MAPRFFSSPYKNALATPAKVDGRWTELPVSSNTVSDSASVIKATDEYWVAQGSSSGHLVCLPYTEPGKFGNKPSTLLVGTGGVVTDFDVSRFGDWIAVGAEDGKISVHPLPALADFTPSEVLSATTIATLSHPSGRAIDTIAFHPTTSSLLLASSKSTVAVFELDSEKPVYTIESPSLVWSAKWSLDGKFVSTLSKDGWLRVYDVRVDCAKPIQEVLAHQGQKCCRHLWLSDDKIFTTGFSKMRDREFSLWDAKDLGKAIKSQRVDTSTAPLVPVADTERNIVYLAGKGDMTLRWVEIGGPSTFTEGGTPVPFMIAGFDLTPPSQLNLMKAEINRLIVLTTDAVVPISIEVPRRQYIDFHGDLFPPVLARTPSQSSKDWLGGKDALLDLIPQDPTKKATPVKQTPKPAQTPVAITPTPSVSKTVATPAPAIQGVSTPTPPTAALEKLTVQDPVSTPPTKTISPPSPSSAPPASTPPPQPKSVATPPPPAPAAVPAKATASSATPPPSTPSTRFNPSWSRKFLSGKTPLKPDYHDVHGLSATIGADTQMLKANKKYFFFPLGGAGGRLGVHPVASTGRLPTAIPSLVCGATIVDFELDPFDTSRVFIASDDSKIRVFKVPDGGLEEDLADVVGVLQDPKMDKIGQLTFHPTAKDLMLSVSDHQGSPTLTLWNVASATALKHYDLPKGGVSSVAWSPDGSLLAVATKTKTILVLDPRSLDTPLTTNSHDSVRPVRLAWMSSTHLISTGFTRAAMREIILYSVTPTKISQMSQTSLDVSPAPLFPFADPDTNILLAYSRGDRSCHAFEIQPSEKTAIARLPSFEHGTLQLGFAFLPKILNDVTAVEILHAFRLTAATIEVVQFSVPRARVEFFQDDVFVPTRDAEKPAIGAEEWMSGKNAEVELVDLCPKGMTRLSEAPETASVISTRNKISKGPQMTESQKQEAYLERLFNAAKEDGDEEEPDRSSHRPQDDDDW